MDQSLQGSELVRAMKARAAELQVAAAASGCNIKRAQALETAARERGFRDWNAAAAAGKSNAGECLEPATQRHWKDTHLALPGVPLRMMRSPSPLSGSIVELMRWAQQLDMIATSVASDARRRMVQLIGGEVPYVFVQARARWSDDVFRLCDRGYEPWPGVTFTHDELAAAGVPEWEAEYGSHGGVDMYSVAQDDALATSDATSLKRLARLLANIALVADQALERQDGEMLPKGLGFRIDLKDASQLNEKHVARLLASRDDSQHRQLRVTADGIAYLSDVVGNNDIDGLAFRLETWAKGNSYVGLAAAADPLWVQDVVKLLRHNWPSPKAKLIDW